MLFRSVNLAAPGGQLNPGRPGDRRGLVGQLGLYLLVAPAGPVDRLDQLLQRDLVGLLARDRLVGLADQGDPANW